MATSESYKDFVLECLGRCAKEYLGGRFAFSARKMFGEYCAYIQERNFCGDFGGESILSGGKKVLFLLCDEQVFIKKYEVLEQIAQDFSAYFSLGFPFSGAKEHYIIDIENLELVAQIIESSLPFLPTTKTSKHTKTLTKANKTQKQTRKHKNTKAESKQNPKK